MYRSLNFSPCCPSAFGLFLLFFLEGEEAIGMEGRGLSVRSSVDPGPFCSSGCLATWGDCWPPGLWEHLRGGQWQRGPAQRQLQL